MSDPINELTQTLNDAAKGGIHSSAAKKVFLFPFKLSYFVLKLLYFTLALLVYVVVFILFFPFLKSVSRVSNISGFMFPARLR